MGKQLQSGEFMRQVLWPVFLAAVASCMFPAWVMFHYVNPADGAELGYAWLVSNGMMPYKDIFIYTPTLHLDFLRTYFSVFGYTIASAKILNLLIRFCLAGATCLLCLRFSRASLAVPAVIVGMTLHYGDIADPSYNHLALLLGVLALNAVVWTEMKSGRHWLLAGICAALAFLIKYTIGAGITACLAGHLLFTGVIARETAVRRGILWRLAIFCASFAATIGFYLATVCASGLMGWFTEQVVVLGPGGKGSLWSSIFRPLTGIYAITTYSVIAVLALVSLVIFYGLLQNEKSDDNKLALRLCLLVVPAWLMAFIPLNIFEHCLQYFEILTGYFGCALMAAGLYGCVLMDRKAMLDEPRALAVLSAFALAYAHAVSWPVFEGMLIPAFPLFICLAAGAWGTKKHGESQGFSTPLKSVAGMLACLMILASVCLKIQNPYEWGWHETPLYEKRYTINDSFFRGVHMNREGYELFSRLQSIAANNTLPTDRIFIFPNMPVLYWVAQRKPVTMAPAHWFDICPDSVARRDAERLLKNPPKLIVWTELGEDFIGFFEKNFRAGRRSGQRDLIRAFETLRPGYELLYSSGPDATAAIKIYLRRETSP